MGKEVFKTLSSYQGYSETIGTGSLILDHLLKGGLKIPSLVQLSGASQAGKSTLAWSIVRQAQLKGYKALYINTESPLEPQHIAALGVDLANVYILEQGKYSDGCLEDFSATIPKILEDPLIKVIVIDSMAAMATKSELENDLGKGSVSPYRLHNRFLNAIKYEFKGLILTITHERQEFGYIPVKVAKGSEYAKYLAAVSILVSRTTEDNTVEQNFKGNGVEGTTHLKMTFKIRKDKASGSEYATESTVFNKNKGRFDTSYEIYKLAEMRKIVEKKAAWVYYTAKDGTEHKYQGVKNFVIALDNCPELAQEILELV